MKAAERGGGETLEFAELRRDKRRSRDERVRHDLAHDRLGALLMRGIEIGEQEADGDRLDAFLAQRDARRAARRFVERLELLAGRRNQPAVHDLAMAALDQRAVLPGQFLPDRIVFDALMAGDMQDVAKALVGDHARARALVLQHRVGRGRRAVEHVVDGGRRDAVRVAELRQCPS